MEQLIKQYLELIDDEKVSKNFSHRLYNYLSNELKDEEQKLVSMDYALPYQFMVDIHHTIFGSHYKTTDPDFGISRVNSAFTGVGYSKKNHSWGQLLPLNKEGKYLLDSYYKKTQQS